MYQPSQKNHGQLGSEFELQKAEVKAYLSNANRREKSTARFYCFSFQKKMF